MCGILAVFELRGDPAAARELALRQVRRLRHRGPDWSGVWADERAVLAHERLAIVDVHHGAQPLVSADGRHVLAVNGEIYNHQALRDEIGSGYPFRTDSDCEVILPLYREPRAAAPRSAARHVRVRALRRGDGRLPDRPRPDRHHPALPRPARRRDARSCPPS